jgi:hypothetical protein
MSPLRAAVKVNEDSDLRAATRAREYGAPYYWIEAPMR